MEEAKKERMGNERETRQQNRRKPVPVDLEVVKKILQSWIDRPIPEDESDYYAEINGAKEGYKDVLRLLEGRYFYKEVSKRFKDDK